MKITIRLIFLILLLSIICSSLGAKVKPKTESELLEDADLVVEGVVVTIDHNLPDFSGVRRITMEVFNIIQGTPEDTIQIIQMRPDYDTLAIIPGLATFAVGDSARVYLIHLVDTFIYDDDGITPIQIPAGTNYHVIHGSEGRRPVGAIPSKDDGDHQKDKNPQDTSDHGIERLDNPPGYLEFDASASAPKCCIYINFKPNAFTDLTPNPGNDINFSAADKTWIKNKIVELVTADYTIPDCPVTVTTNESDCDGASFKVTIDIGGSTPGGDDILGRAKDSRPGDGCISGKTVKVWTQEYGFEDGDKNWAGTKEKMAQAVANVAAHEAGHQFGAKHLADNNRIMDDVTKPLSDLGTINQTFGKAAKNKIRDCCCPHVCINKYAVGRFDWRRETIYTTKETVKIVNAYGAKKEDPSGSGNWVPISDGEVLPSGTRVRVSIGSVSRVIPYESKSFTRSASLDGTIYLHLEQGYVSIEECGLCFGDEHCAVSTPLGEFYITESDPDSNCTTMDVSYDPDDSVTTVCNRPISDFSIDFLITVGVDSGMIYELPPSFCATITKDGQITINPYPSPTIAIEKTHDAYQGHFEYVSITLEDSPIEMGGFDFLIAYDASALTFTEASKGQLLEDCGWEYFTYRYGVQGNCGDACPSGLLRIIAIAETNNGPYEPSCYGPPDTDPHGLADMRFLVTNDRTFEGQYVPIYFFWDDCSDNSISNVNGDTLYIDRAVYDFEETLIWNEDDDDLFPEDARIPFVGAPDYCLNPDPDKPSAIRLIDFVNGGIDIIPADSIDRKGDINLNGVPNEIADATVFTNYFIYGLDAFMINVEGQTAATDVNADGTPLTVGDLVYLIRVIVGDALPIPKLTPNSRSASVNMIVIHSAVGITSSSEGDIGAGYFVFEHRGYKIGEPHLINGASNMTLKYSDENGILRILIYSMEEGRQIAAGAENIFIIPIDGDGMIELTEAQLCDYNGNMMISKIEDEPILPKDFALHQNYPNPFNITTQIIYELPRTAHVRIDVINTMGQEVTTLIDRLEQAGVHRIEWNGTDRSGNDVASGIYFYRIESEGYAETKKMTLLK